MRGSFVAAAALVVAVLAVVFTSMNTGTVSTNDKTVAAANPAAGQLANSKLLKASATTSQDAGTFSYSVNLTVKGTPLGDQTVTGSGAADLNAQQASFSGTILGTQFQAVGDKTTGYVQSDLLGSGWYRLDLNSLDKGATEPFVMPISSPTQAFSLLQNVADRVDTIGPDTVNGVSTTHYKATVDLSKVASTLNHPQTDQQLQGTVPVDVWVDANGLIVQASVDYTGAALSSGPVGISEIIVTVDFSNYGQPVTITIPPASDVKDFSASNLGALSGAFSKSGH